MSYIIKIGLIGDYNVGKTSIIHNYFNINNKTTVTLGVDFKTVTKKYENIDFKLHIWDTSGQEKFKSIVSSYYRDLDVILLIYDSSDITTFENIQKWLDDIYIYNKKNLIKILVGNKTDKSNMVINYKKGLKYAELNDLKFFQTTITVKETINKLFDSIIEICYNRLLRNEIELKTFVNYDKLNIEETIKNKNKNKKCCIIQ